MTIQISRTQEELGIILVYYKELGCAYTVTVTKRLPGAKEWGINWAALGTIGAEEARMYADLINRAIRVAEKQTRKEVK